MKTVYACIHYMKTVEIDHFENGCDPDSRRLVSCESMNLTADTLPALLKSICRRFFFHEDCDWFIPTEDDGISFIGYNQLEDDDGYLVEITDDAHKDFVAGKRTLWLADYVFHIEKRIVSPLTAEDLQGVKFHE